MKIKISRELKKEYPDLQKQINEEINTLVAEEVEKRVKNLNYDFKHLKDLIKKKDEEIFRLNAINDEYAMQIKRLSKSDF
jgi:paraquat-inducible protein B